MVKMLNVHLISVVLAVLLWGCGNSQETGDTEFGNKEKEQVIAEQHSQNKKTTAKSTHTNTKMEGDSTMQPYELMQAALDGNADTVKKALESGINPNISDGEGQRPLMLAAYNGHVDVMKMLITEGAKIDVADKSRRTPLMFASTGPFPKAVKLLVDHGAEVNAIDNGEGWTPLMFAAAEGNTEVVKVLLEAGADPSIIDVDDDTAYSFAAKNQHTETAELLSSK